MRFGQTHFKRCLNSDAAVKTYVLSMLYNYNSGAAEIKKINDWFNNIVN